MVVACCTTAKEHSSKCHRTAGPTLLSQWIHARTPPELILLMPRKLSRTSRVAAAMAGPAKSSASAPTMAKASLVSLPVPVSTSMRSICSGPRVLSETDVASRNASLNASAVG